MKLFGFGLAAFSMLVVFSGCGESKQPAAAPASPPPVASAEPAKQPQPAPTDAAAAKPAAADAGPKEEKELEEPAEDDKGTTPARPSLLFGLMLQPAQFVMQSTMESVQGVAGSLTGGGVPGVPGLPGLGGGGRNAPSGDNKPAEQKPDGDNSEKKEETKADTSG